MFAGLWTAAVLYLFVQCLNGCGPNAVGCYYGDATSGIGGLQMRQCDGLNNNWCAISYQPNLNTAQYMCANQIPITFGSQPMNCGEGALGINNQGCQTFNTPNGPCYLCCCVGPQCNNPIIFGREASRYFSNNGNLGGFLPFYNSSDHPSISILFFLSLISTLNAFV